jgi:hypothetical protein
MSQIEGLKKELVRVRAKARILEKLIELRCDVRDCNFSVKPQDGWKTPKGYPLAVSFDVVGAASFVVYGSDIESIRKAALFYGSTKYGANRLSKERVEDQSQIGRWVDAGGTVNGVKLVEKLVENPVEIVGIYPTWFLGDESPCNETMYITDKGRRFTLSDLQNRPDWNWENFDIDAD